MSLSRQRASPDLRQDSLAGMADQPATRSYPSPVEELTPVPETEQVEEFIRMPLPVPTLRIPDATASHRSADTPKPRRTTDPLPSSPLSPAWSTPSMPYRSRNTSPYSRGHLRSKSSTSPLAPQMARTQSMPGVNTAGQLSVASPYQRPASPSSPRGSPSGRVRLARKAADETFPGLGISARSLQDINEREPIIMEEELTPRAVVERSISPILGLPHSNSYPRIRRPASPLRYVSQPGSSSNTAPGTPTSLGSSPSLTSLSRFDYGPAGYSGSGSGYFTSSSIPSTPTSARSRSPSISSLETIPDSPDAEEAAVEADRMAQLKADAEDEDDTKSRNAPESTGSRGRALVGFGSRDKRKRWSVCGGERRGDLNLDTIWED